MILYHVLKKIVGAMRAVQVALMRIIHRIDKEAEGYSIAARASGLDYLRKKEDAAHEKYLALREAKQTLVMKLQADIDDAEDALYDLVEDHKELRTQITNEVL